MNLRLILRIARTELAVLFYSPVAWLLLIAFTCQVGFDFMNILTEIVKIKALGNTITFSVTAGFVLGLKGIYEVIRFFVKFGGNLFFISTVFFFLNPIKSCRYVCFLVTLKTPHH